MLQRIKDKLTSKQGVSFLFALLAFLVATMVSVTIINAALTAAQRVSNDRDTLQDHMTMGSAAELVRDEMLSTKVTRKDVTTTKIVNGVSSVVTTRTYEAEGTFEEEMRQAVMFIEDVTHGQTALYPNYYSTTESVDNSFTVSIAGQTNVNVTYIMQNANEDLYKVVFTFTMDGSSETLYLSMIGTATRSGDTTTYVWGNPYINGLNE